MCISPWPEEEIPRNSTRAGGLIFHSNAVNAIKHSTPIRPLTRTISSFGGQPILGERLNEVLSLNEFVPGPERIVEAHSHVVAAGSVNGST